MASDWNRFTHAPPNDLARLISKSLEAQQHFQNVIEGIANHRPYPHSQYFLHFEPIGPLNSNTDRPLYRGFFRFNKDAPCHDHNTWTAGSGRSDRSVEFMLTKGHLDLVGGVHLHFHLLSDSILMAIAQRQDVIIDGKLLKGRDDLLMGQGKDYQRILRQQSVIEIGDLAYVVEFSQPSGLLRHLDASIAREDLPVFPPASPPLDICVVGNYTGSLPFAARKACSFHAVLHSNTEQHFVLKRVRRSHGMVGRVANEIRLLGEMDHPNIATLIEQFTVPARYTNKGLTHVTDTCFVLAPPITQTLAQYCREGMLPPRDQISELQRFGFALRISQRLASALDYLHSNDIMHRDITAESIGLIPERASVILLDSEHAARGRFSKELLSERSRYHAPEVMALHDSRFDDLVLGHGYGFPADVYSLGLVLTETIYRRLMIDDGRSRDRLLSMLRERVDASLSEGPNISRVDSSWLVHIKDMVKWNPRDRITAARLSHLLGR